MAFVTKSGLEKPYKKESDQSYRVCYCFHPSYTELRNIISYLCPQKVEANVVPINHTREEVQRRLNRFLEVAGKLQKRGKSSQEVVALGPLRKRKRYKGPSAPSQFSQASDLSDLNFGETPEKKKTKTPEQSQQNSESRSPDGASFPLLLGNGHVGDSDTGEKTAGDESEEDNHSSYRGSAEDGDSFDEELAEYFDDVLPEDKQSLESDFHPALDGALGQDVGYASDVTMSEDEEDGCDGDGPARHEVKHKMINTHHEPSDNLTNTTHVAAGGDNLDGSPSTALNLSQKSDGMASESSKSISILSPRGGRTLVKDFGKSQDETGGKRSLELNSEVLDLSKHVGDESSRQDAGEADMDVIAELGAGSSSVSVIDLSVQTKHFNSDGPTVLKKMMNNKKPSTSDNTLQPGPSSKKVKSSKPKHGKESTEAVQGYRSLVSNMDVILQAAQDSGTKRKASASEATDSQSPKRFRRDSKAQPVDDSGGSSHDSNSRDMETKKEERVQPECIDLTLEDDSSKSETFAKWRQQQQKQKKVKKSKHRANTNKDAQKPKKHDGSCSSDGQGVDGDADSEGSLGSPLRKKCHASSEELLRRNRRRKWLEHDRRDTGSDTDNSEAGAASSGSSDYHLRDWKFQQKSAQMRYENARTQSPSGKQNLEEEPDIIVLDDSSKDSQVATSSLQKEELKQSHSSQNFVEKQILTSSDTSESSQSLVSTIEDQPEAISCNKNCPGTLNNDQTSNNKDSVEHVMCEMSVSGTSDIIEMRQPQVEPDETIGKDVVNDNSNAMDLSRTQFVISCDRSGKIGMQNSSKLDSVSDNSRSRDKNKDKPLGFHSALSAIAPHRPPGRQHSVITLSSTSEAELTSQVQQQSQDNEATTQSFDLGDSQKFSSSEDF